MRSLVNQFFVPARTFVWKCGTILVFFKSCEVQIYRYVSTCRLSFELTWCYNLLQRMSLLSIKVMLHSLTCTICVLVVVVKDCLLSNELIEREGVGKLASTSMTEYFAVIALMRKDGFWTFSM